WRPFWKQTSVWVDWHNRARCRTVCWRKDGEQRCCAKPQRHSGRAQTARSFICRQACWSKRCVGEERTIEPEDCDASQRTSDSHSRGSGRYWTVGWKVRNLRFQIADLRLVVSGQ